MLDVATFIVVLVLLSYACFFFGASVVKRRKRSNRTEKHDDKVLCLTAWLDHRPILKAAAEAGVLNDLSRRRILNQIGEMSEPELDVVMFNLLKPRVVRDVVAKFMSDNSWTGRKEQGDKLGAFVDRMALAERNSLAWQAKKLLSRSR